MFNLYEVKKQVFKERLFRALGLVSLYSENSYSLFFWGINTITLKSYFSLNFLFNSQVYFFTIIRVVFFFLRN